MHADHFPLPGSSQRDIVMLPVPQRGDRIRLLFIPVVFPVVFAFFRLVLGNDIMAGDSLAVMIHGLLIAEESMIIGQVVHIRDQLAVAGVFDRFSQHFAHVVFGIDQE